MTLLFLLALGLLAALSAASFLSEKKLAENLIASRQEELVFSSALEHLQALFEAAQLFHPGSWLAAGKAGPYVLKGRDYTLKLSPVADNLAYQEFWDGAEWLRQSPAALASPGEIAAKEKRAAVRADASLFSELALILSDACDENHALQERAGVYGAEAVDFSEILSDDGSELRFLYRANSVYKERAVTSLPYFYGHRDYDAADPVTENKPEARELFDPRTARYVLKDECKRENGLVLVKLSEDALTESSESSLLKAWRKKKQKQFPATHLWQNCRIAFFGLAVKGITPRAVFGISDSDGDFVCLKDEEGLFNSITNSSFRFAQLRGWVHSETLYSEAPRQPLWLAVSDLQKGKYYEVLFQDANFPVPLKDAAHGLDRSRKLAASGKIESDEEAESEGYAVAYAKGEPQKADLGGGMELVVKSPADCSPRNRVRLNSVYFRRPDIISVVNKSRKPIFLSNWRLTAQTGEGSSLLGVLPDCAALCPGARFYLTDQPEIVTREYGFGKPEANFTKSDAVIKLPRESWGLDYKIGSVREIKKGAQYFTYVGCENARWEKDELTDEVAELKGGLRFPIEGGNTKDTLIFSNLRLERYGGIKAGDEIRIAGLPRHVEYASLTLKNEYSQMAARTKGIKRPRDAKLYSSLKKEKELWQINEYPFANFAPGKGKTYFDRTLTNSLEVLKALENRESETLGELEELYLSSDSLTLYAKDFPASEAGFQGDWQLAGGIAEKQERGIAFKNGSWPDDFWKSSKLRFASGELKDEIFVITGSFKNVVLPSGASLPGKKRLKDFRSGSASLGPGYKNIFYAAYKNNAQGEWTFSNLWDCAGGELYLKGLSDAINSGEFLEENHNARLEPELFDFEKKAWEKYPALRFDKNDAAFLAVLEKRHVSPGGNLSLKMTARNLDDPKGSGRAWFQGLAVCPPRRPVKITRSENAERGPIPLTVPQKILPAAEGPAEKLLERKECFHPTRSLFKLEVKIASRLRRALLSIGPVDPRTGLRKLNFQKLP